MGEVIKLRQYGRGGWQETRGEIYKAIMQGREFESGAMQGKRTKMADYVRSFSKGRLDSDWWTVLIDDNPDYVIYSYSTPIAWHVPPDSDEEDGDERWVIPKVYYSATTSRHQNLVRTALVFDKKMPVEDLWVAREGRSEPSS